MKLAYAQGRVVSGEKKSARVDLWLEPAMKVALEFLAERDRRKLSEYVRVVLEQHIADYAARREETKESD